MNRSSRQKVNKEIPELTDVINQMDLTDIYRSFHSNTKEYTFFSALHGILSKTDQILGHKASPNRNKKSELIHAFYQSTTD